MRSRKFQRAKPEGIPKTECAPRFESRYKHYPIYKGDETLAIAIGRATYNYKAISISKPREEKKILVWLNNNNRNSISLINI